MDTFWNDMLERKKNIYLNSFRVFIKVNFAWYFSGKTTANKGSKKDNSAVIIFITQIAVALGIIVGHITFSTGIGAKLAIKEKLSDFYGHIVITSLDSNNSHDSSPISLRQFFYPRFPSDLGVDHVSTFATRSGVLRKGNEIEAIIFKGIALDYDRVRLQKFLVKGYFPDLNKTPLSDEVLLSKKQAVALKLDVGSFFICYFLKSGLSRPIVRRFNISGLYETGIKNFDDVLVIGDIRQVQSINGWNSTYVGGFDVFVKDINQISSVEKQINRKISYKLNSESVLNRFQNIIDWIQIFDINIFIVVLIVSVVVIINMAVLLLILILERVRTIGILKTLGTGNWLVQKIFIFYALRIMLSALFIGNVVGLGALLLQKKFQCISLNPDSYYISVVPVHLDFTIILLINFFSVLICVITLIFPSFLINKISPIRSIKFD
ncbi:MAG: ABC transporter permease [Flavobacteriales bacterium Tduv]